MVLDSIAVRNLELVRSNAEGKKYGSLLWLLDKTRTGMGARLLNQMILSPLKDIEKINYRQEGVAELFNASVVRMGLADTLKEVKDIERLSGKISNGNFSPPGLRGARGLPERAPVRQVSADGILREDPCGHRRKSARYEAARRSAFLRDRG